MPVWGRLHDVEAGKVHRLEQPVVTVGRKDANKADILVEGAQANRAGSHFCSTIQFQLRHHDGKTWGVDSSQNGTFLNLDESAAADAFTTFKQEQKWLNEQNPDPRLAKGDGQEIFDGDQIYFRLSFDRGKFTRFVFYRGPGGTDSDTSEGEDEQCAAMKQGVTASRRLSDREKSVRQQHSREDDDGEERPIELESTLEGEEGEDLLEVELEQQQPSSSVGWRVL